MSYVRGQYSFGIFEVSPRREVFQLNVLVSINCINIYSKEEFKMKEVKLVDLLFVSYLFFSSMCEYEWVDKIQKNAEISLQFSVFERIAMASNGIISGNSS